MKLKEIDSRERKWAIGMLLPVGVLFMGVVVLIIGFAIPFHPFVVKSVGVSPNPVCTSSEVEVKITRKFTQDLEKLALTESWVTHKVPGLGNGLPVISSSGVLPQDALTRRDSPGFVTVDSPLLREAPPLPGTYRIKIQTESFGTRWGILPTDGTATYYSKPVKVIQCDGKEQTQ